MPPPPPYCCPYPCPYCTLPLLTEPPAPAARARSFPGLATDDAPAERPSPPAASFLVPVEVPGTHVLSLPGGAPLLAEVVAGGAPAARVLTLRSRLALCNECQVAGPLPRPVRAPAARAPAGLPVVGP